MSESIVAFTRTYTYSTFVDPIRRSDGYRYDRVIHGEFVTSGTALQRYDRKDSVSTPGWYASEKTASVRYSPRKINLSVYLRKPVAPKYNPPKFKIRAKPLREERFALARKNPHIPGTSDFRRYSERAQKFELSVNRRREEKYLVRLKLWELYERRRVQRLKDYRESYYKRHEKFLNAQTRYLRRLKIVRNWQHKPRKGRVLCRTTVDNPYNLVSIEFVGESSPIFLRWDATPLDPTAHMNFAPIFSWSTVHIQNLVTQLYVSMEPERIRSKAHLSSKFYDKLANQKVHVANIIAERAQTLDLLSSTVKRLSALLSGKKKLLASASHYLVNPKKIANDFLALKFGVEPLVSDIKGAAEVLAESLGPNDELVVTIRTNRKTPLDFLRGGMRVLGEMEASYVVKYKVPNPFARTLQSFGLINTTEVLWEVTPWSFVVDWIIPIGKYLNQLSAETGIEFMTGTYAERVVASVTFDQSPESLGSTYESSYHGSGTFVYHRKIRTVLTSPPEKLRLVIKNPLSWTHGFLSAALVIQRLKIKLP